MKLRSRHLLGLEGMTREEITFILDTAESFKEILERPIRIVPTLRGVTVVNLFYEPSTRTRISFELAEKRLSAEVVSFSANTSSVKKGNLERHGAQHRGHEDRHGGGQASMFGSSVFSYPMFGCLYNQRW